MAPTIDELAVADEPEAWSGLGFEVDGETCVVGDVGSGLLARLWARG